MFHAARAILFTEGVIEKSHVCLVEYLGEEYAKKGRIGEGLANSLDRMRTDRHEAVYRSEASAGKGQADRALKQSMEFLEAARELVSMRKTG